MYMPMNACMILVCTYVYLYTQLIQHYLSLQINHLKSMLLLFYIRAYYMHACMHVHTIQLNLNLNAAWAWHDTFFIYTCSSIHVHIRLMTSNLSFKALVYAVDMCTTVLQMHACMSGTHISNLDYMHANCKPRTVELTLSTFSFAKVWFHKMPIPIKNFLL